MKPKHLILTVMGLLLLTGNLMGQTPKKHATQRDRRVDVNITCLDNACVSSTGQLWIVSRCGDVYTADSIGASWHNARIKNVQNNYLWSEPTFDRVAAFGNNVAVAAGFISDQRTDENNFALRTSGDCQWDTVTFGKGDHWIDGFFFTVDGRMWMGSNEGLLTYSADSGRTFTVLRDSAFDSKMGIDDIYMVSADSGWIGGHGNAIYSTSDNWRSFHRWTTPQKQGLYTVTDPHSQYWVTQTRSWKGWLIASQAGMSFYSPLAPELHWQRTPLPLTVYEVDTLSDCLWALTDSGQLVLTHDMEHWEVVRNDIKIRNTSICGVMGKRVYLLTNDGVVRVAPDGRSDTCEFFTEDLSLEQDFEQPKEGYYYPAVPEPLLHHGRQWLSYRNSIYLKDAQGWYRVAKPGNSVDMRPDPDRDDRVIILLFDEHNYSVDTSGHMEPYTYRQPLEAFVKSGLESVEIKTYYGGCFHYDVHTVAYTREGNRLSESKNSLDSNLYVVHFFSADSLEQALLRLGERYSQFPSPVDFGLKENDVDLKNIFSREGSCTSYSGFQIIFVNRDGDTLSTFGQSDAECGDYFPWLLPMFVHWREASFFTYQPSLWMALKPLMPKGMHLREKLNNLQLVGPQPCDLLFFRDEEGMGGAVKESTGEYTHVALVESVGDTIWIIDATPSRGVARRPLPVNWGDKGTPDLYRFAEDNPVEDLIYKNDVLKRAHSFIGQPYDNAFLPDNGALYCSEFIYECFINSFNDSPNVHLFEAKPMNWRNKKGKLPRYWKRHFRKLGIPVPEGVLGTNPTDLSRSPLLRKCN